MPEADYQAIRLSENRMAVIKSSDRPPIKTISAIVSSNRLLFPWRRIDRKEQIQLAIKKMMAKMVISSMIVFCDLSSSFSDVSTIKQIPSRLEEALRI